MRSKAVLFGELQRLHVRESQSNYDFTMEGAQRRIAIIKDIVLLTRCKYYVDVLIFEVHEQRA